jgi:UDP-glucose 4-epimerase
MMGSKKPMNVLVTGGAGYIGSVTTALLVSEGYRVTVLDNLSSGYLKAIVPGAKFVRGDVSDKKVVTRICREGIDVVMHFAASIKVGESVAHPSEYYENNVVKSLRFFDYLRACSVDNIVYSSSAAVYGEPETIPLTELTTLRPVNPYGRTKMMVEQILRDYDRAYHFKSVSLRYFNAGGAYGSCGEDHRPESHLIPLALDSVTRGAPLLVYGTDYDTRDGSCVRDYIHIKDIAEAHILAAQYLFNGGATDCFNLGTGTGYSVLEVLKCIERVTGRQVSYTMSGRREGDSAVLVASPKKAQQILGWKKNLSSLEDIVTSAWAWKKQNPHGYGER